MPSLLQIDFPFSGPFGEELAEMLDDLARDIAAEPELSWKIWTETEDEEQAGGIYLFSDKRAAERYLDKHVQRLNSFGITDVRVRLFDVNQALTEMTGGPLASQGE